MNDKVAKVESPPEVSKDAPSTPAPTPTTANGDVPLEEQVAQLQKQLESADRRIKDTYASYQSGQEKLRKMERDMKERELHSARPAILDETEGLQEAIRYVAELERAKPTQEDIWTDTVARALPDLDELMADETFRSSAMAQRQATGETWNDPIIAVNKLGSLRADYLRDKAVAESRKFSKDTKTDAMEVPGGHGGGANKREAPRDEAQEIRSMSDADFRKMRDKVLGYSS